MFVVVFASLTSTLDSLLASTADLLAEDVYFRLLRPQASDAQLKQAARQMVVGLAVVTLALSWPRLDSLASVLFFTGALVASTVWPVACGLYWSSANRWAAIVAMVAGSAVGLTAYVLIAPYCAAVFSAAVSAVVMVVGSRWQPERFDFNRLARRRGERHGDVGVAHGSGGPTLVPCRPGGKSGGARLLCASAVVDLVD